MNRALGYLLLRSARNRMTRHLLRLRRPRYAIALAAGLAYVGFFLLSQSGTPARGEGAVPAWLPLVGSLGLAFLAARWWLFGEDQNILAYRPAEVQFLFPAPISRGTLLRWKLVRAQGPILLNTLLWTVIVNRFSGRWFDVLSFWILFSTIHLHRLGAALVRTSVREHGGRAVRRHAIALVVFAGIGAGVLAGLALHWPEIRLARGGTLRTLAGVVGDALSSGFPQLALAPFRALLAPLRAATAEVWVGAVWPAAALLVAHYIWVVRSDAAFLETAVLASAARAEAFGERQKRGLRQPVVVRRRPWFRLRSSGSRALAILWKNVLLVTRKLSPGWLVAGVATALLLPAVASTMGEAQWATMIGSFGLGVTAMLVVFGPVRIRNDLRGDLAHISQLRTWPMNPVAIVAAEVAASVVVLTVWEYGMVVLSLIALGFGGEIIRLDSTMAAIVMGILLFLPIVNAFAVILQNAGALLFPGWVHAGPSRGGVEALGQQMLTIVATFLMVVLLLVPPVPVAVVAYLAMQGVSGMAAAATSTVLFTAGCLLEIWMLLSWLGAVFGRLDPSEVLIEEEAGR